LTGAVPSTTGKRVAVAFVDRGYTGKTRAMAVRAPGIEPERRELPAATQSSVLVPPRRAVDRCRPWATRLGRLVQHDERYAPTGPTLVAFVRPAVKQAPRLASNP
jgi:hypothetical protein